MIEVGQAQDCPGRPTFVLSFLDHGRGLPYRASIIKLILTLFEIRICR